MVRILILILGLSVISCDYVATGEICNRRDEKIKLLIFPDRGGAFSSDDLTLVAWDTLESKGHYELESKKCFLVASSINSWRQDDIPITYIEIRTSADTIIVDNQRDIFLNFKESKRFHYKWDIN